MNKKLKITEIVSNRLIAEYVFDYENTTNVTDEDVLENAWLTAIKEELVNRNDWSMYLIQIIADETMHEKGIESDKLETPVL